VDAAGGVVEVQGDAATEAGIVRTCHGIHHADADGRVGVAGLGGLAHKDQTRAGALPLDGQAASNPYWTAPTKPDAWGPSHAATNGCG
jgi:hypothetical protein